MLSNIVTVRLDVMPGKEGILTVERSEAPLVQKRDLPAHQVTMILHALDAFVGLERQLHE